MDSETLDLVLGQVATMWARPLEEFERDQWLRWLNPPIGAAPDPEFVVEALLLMKRSPAFEHMRPDLVAFQGSYNRVVVANQPPPASTDPENMEATPETVQSVLAQCRETLAQADRAAEELRAQRSKLLHAMVKADIRQGQLL